MWRVVARFSRRQPQRLSTGTRWRLRAVDALAAAWIAAWIVVAILVGIDVSHLNQLSSTLGVAGRALAATGRGIKKLSHIPLVGHDVARVANQLIAAGSRVTSTARSVSGSVNRLSYLLPIVITLVPVVPTLAIYLPVRIQRNRELRAVRRALAQSASDEAVEWYLARRAVAMLPFHELRKVTRDPWEDLESGEIRTLAEAELRRLGMDPRIRLGTEDGTAAARQ